KVTSVAWPTHVFHMILETLRNENYSIHFGRLILEKYFQTYSKFLEAGLSLKLYLMSIFLEVP
ncbi:hypothetical protein EAY27_21320, partial [Vibrio anguillarum]|nr:hypothetical protein [Vibrio anguillarum]MBF4442472.1 hypothetical protein [Vibrio anguillarum]